MFILWRYGKEKQWLAKEKGRPRLNHLVLSIADGKPRFVDASGGGVLTSIKGRP
jgi:hypothetical protein